MQLAFSVLPPVHIAPSSHALSLAVQAFSIDSCCRYVCQLASLPPVDKWHDRAVKTRLLPRSPSPPQVYTCLRHTITKGCNCTSEAPDTMDQSTQTRKPSHAAASSEGDSLLIQPGAQPFESCFPPAVVPAVTRQSSRKRTFTEKGAEMMKYLAPAKKQKIEQDKAVAGTLGTASGKKQLPSMKIPTRIGKYSALEVEPREQEEKKVTADTSPSFIARTNLVRSVNQRNNRCTLGLTIELSSKELMAVARHPIMTRYPTVTRSPTMKSILRRKFDECARGVRATTDQCFLDWLPLWGRDRTVSDCHQS